MYRTLIRYIGVLICFFLPTWNFANHITGAEITYRCINPAQNRYEINLTVYRDCNLNNNPNNVGFDNPVEIFIFRGNGGLLQNSITVAAPTTTPRIIPPNWSACSAQPYTICVEEGVYTVQVTLAPRIGGYDIGWARCCRNTIISNITPRQGVSVTAHIPGSNELPTGCNSQPVFNNLPPQFLCANETLNFDHSATDPDGDSLVYSICPPYTGTNQFGQGATGNRPTVTTQGPPFLQNPMRAPPYALLNFTGTFSAQNAFGPNVPFSIDPQSGQLTIRPNTNGTFAFAICVREFRNGVLLSENKRDFQINVITCSSQGQPPTVGAVTGPGGGIDTFTVNVADTFCYNVRVQAATAGDSVQLFPSSAVFGLGNTFPGNRATLTPTTANPNVGQVTAEVCWVPECRHAGDTVRFVVGGNNISDCFGFNVALDTVVVIVTGAETPTYTRTTSGGQGTPVRAVPNRPFCITINAADTDPLDSLLFKAELFPPGATITRNVSGNTGSATICWTPDCNQAGQTLRFVTQIVDTNACNIRHPQFDTLDIAVFPLPTLRVTPPTDTLCFGQSTQLRAAMVGISSMVWLPATGVNNPTSPTTNATPTASRTYVARITDTNGCVQEDSAEIVVNPLPVITVTPDTFNCPGDSLPLRAGGGATYQWQPATGLSNPNIANPLAAPLAPQTYQLTVTTAAGCTDDTTVFINTTTWQTGPNRIICFGDTTTVSATASNGATFAWTPNARALDANTPVARVFPQLSTNYAVAITDTMGCVINDTVAVTVNPLPVINAGPDTAMCIFDTIPLRSFGGVSYQWDPDPTLSATNIANPLAFPQSSRSYYVTVVDANGCVNRDTVDVIVNPLPIPEAGNDTAKCGQNGVLLTATGGVNYAWLPTDGLNLPNSAQPVANPDSSTQYFVRVTDANGCSAVDSVFVRAMYADAGPDVQICIGDTTQLQAGGGVSYTWTPNIALSALTIPDPFASPLDTTDYVVTAVDTTGCFDLDTVRVTVNPLPTITISSPDPYVCNRGATQLTATGGVIYRWRPDTTLSNLNTATPVARPVNVSGNLEDTVLYFVTVTDSNTCVNSDSFEMRVRILPIVTASNDTFACPGTNVPISAAGGTTVQWSPAVGLDDPTIFNPIAAPDTTTRYVADVTARWGCSDTASVVVYTIAPQAGPDRVICLNDSTQLLGNGGVSYAWTPSTGLNDTTLRSPMASPRVTTTYIVTVTDSVGCVANDTVTVTVNPLPPAVAGPDQTICLFDSVLLLASGGVQYQWDPDPSLRSPGTPATFVRPFDTTTFYVTVTDANGCSERDSATVTVNLLPPADAGNDLTKCGEPGVQLQASGGVVYQWFPTDSLSDATIANPIATPTDTTKYYVAVTDTNGCRNLDSVIVRTMYAFADPGGTICFGDTFQLNASGGVGYSWQPGASLSDSLVADPVAMPGDTTLFVVTVLDPSGCTDTASVWVNVQPAPPADAGPDTSVCFGLSVQLQASGGVAYQWDADPTLSDPSIADPVATPTDTTWYYVTVTGANGCTWRDSVKIDIHPLPVADAGGDLTICRFDTTQLNGSGAAFFAWTNGGSLSDDSVAMPRAFPTVTTNYQLTVTDLNGCQDVDSARITVNPLPIPDAGADATICVLDSTRLQASGGVSYLWQPGLLIGRQSADPIAFPRTTTTFFVTVTDENGCSDTDSVTVTVNPLPDADAGEDQEICVNETAQLQATGGVNYLWSPGATLSDSTIANPVADPPVSQTIYTVTVTDANGCVKSDRMVVAVNPLPAVQILRDTTICQGFAATLRATRANDYVWDADPDLDTLRGARVRATPDSTKWFYVLGIDANLCRDRDSVLVTVIPKPDIDGTPTDSVCRFQFAELSVEGGVRAEWSTGLDAYDLRVSPVQSTQYWALVYDEENCPSDSFFADVFVEQDLPRARFTAEPARGFGPLAVSFLNESSGATQYFWRFGDAGIFTEEGTSTDRDPSYIFVDDGLYDVTLRVDNEIGCPDSLTIPAAVEVFTERLYFPNAFTPNGDNQNEVFYIKGGGYPEWELRIYSRWGQLVFTSTSPNEGWDGRFEGNDMPEGVYVWQLEARSAEGTDVQRSGTVTLIR